MSNTHSRLSYFFSVTSRYDCSDESVNAPNLTNGDFVPLIVASQIRQDSSSAGDHVDVRRAEELNERLQKAFEAIDFGPSVRQIPQSPQTILDEALGWMSQVHGKCLHPPSFYDGGFVA